MAPGYLFSGSSTLNKTSPRPRLGSNCWGGSIPARKPHRPLVCPEGSGVPELADGGESTLELLFRETRALGQYPDWKAWERMNQACSLMASLTAGPESWGQGCC